MKLRYKISLVVVAFLIIASLFLVQSYALWLTTYEGQENILSVGCFDVALEELSKPISLNNTYPMSDQKGLTQTPYKFTIKNTCNTSADYVITLNTLKTATIDKSKIKFAFTTGTNVPTSGVNLGTYASVASNINTDLAYLQTENILGDTLNESIILQKGTLKNENDTATFNLYLWIDETAGNEVQGQKFLASVNVLANATTVEPTATETITTLVSGADTSSTDVYTVPDKTSDSCTYTLAYDGTSDNNLRYVGANPCNYVKIDDEYWRIIGLMNNIDDGTGKKETRIKLIRNESIGEYSWDISESSENHSYVVNEWSQADLMKLLNPGYESESVGGSLYYNGKSGYCYNLSIYDLASCNFTSSGLKGTLKALIDDVVWNTGTNGTNSWKSASNGLASHFYSYERSSNNGKICTSGNSCNDTVERTTTWKGKIGLMYPSDYGYATSGGSTSTRTSCLNKELYNWDSASDCKNNDWLYNSSNSQWTISPAADSSYAIVAFDVYTAGNVQGDDVHYAGVVRPSVYLIPSTSILGGEGTPENPYEIG
uniref:hypothetical protein n=1 Tax=Candidatus Ventrenecus sp. TaxID=3085654 RepID=UPI004024B3E1